MSEIRAQLIALAAKWRAEADRVDQGAGDWSELTGTLRECAEELEAVLRAAAEALAAQDKEVQWRNDARCSLCGRKHIHDVLRRLRSFCYGCQRQNPDDEQTPADAECTRCGELDCPHNEPLHYHHDGCPACIDDERCDPKAARIPLDSEQARALDAGSAPASREAATPPEHRCGVRGFADSGDVCPGCRARDGEAPPPASNGWQAIETAPKDGTPIIAISQIGNIYKMVYENEGWFSKNTGRWLLPEEVAGWMPLPLVPERRTPADDPERT